MSTTEKLLEKLIEERMMEAILPFRRVCDSQEELTTVLRASYHASFYPLLVGYASEFADGPVEYLTDAVMLENHVDRFQLALEETIGRTLREIKAENESSGEGEENACTDTQD